MKVLSKEGLLRWLEKLGKERLLVAPRDVGGNVLLHAPVSKVEDIVLDFTNTTLSPKGWFFPSSEAIFAFQQKDGKAELIPTQEVRDTVIFGIRPCDALGLKVMDRPMLAEPEDTTYRERRSRTALIGLSCSEGCPQGFCTSAGTGPQDASNVDVLVTRSNESYIAQAVTETGKQLLSQAEGEEREVSLPEPPTLKAVPTENISEKARQSFNSPYWGRLADRCIHCNICSYVCPVCYCFDIRDYKDHGKIERIRCWESCQSKGFTQIAGGYERRPDKGSKLRQRFGHKLLYFPEEFGVLHCTGCGRCVVSCPVNIDIREIISDLQKMGAKVNA